MPTVCQVNVEMHYAEENYGVTIDEFDATLNALIDEANWIILRATAHNDKIVRLYLFNGEDPKCVKKFMCLST